MIHHLAFHLYFVWEGSELKARALFVLAGSGYLLSLVRSLKLLLGLNFLIHYTG